MKKLIVDISLEYEIDGELNIPEVIGRILESTGETIASPDYNDGDGWAVFWESTALQHHEVRGDMSDCEIADEDRERGVDVRDGAGEWQTGEGPLESKYTGPKHVSLTPDSTDVYRDDIESGE